MPLQGGLRENIAVLEPLTSAVRPRELVVATKNPEWTAIFDCGLTGGDPVSSVGFLSRSLQLQGVVVVSIPDSSDDHHRDRRPAARQFEMFAPIRTGFLNYVRTVSVVQDGAKWRFDANGTIQDFEDVEAYARRKVADRFTPSMLVDYADALGLRPFDDDFFPGPSALVTNPSTLPSGARALSLREARHWHGYRS